MGRKDSLGSISTSSQYNSKVAAENGVVVDDVDDEGDGDGDDDVMKVAKLKKSLHGRNLFARTYALEQQGGYTLLHLAAHLGYVLPLLC
jgi:hypothetical protein